MLRIMKNNWYRLMEQKAYLIVAVFLTVCAVGAAVILTNKVEQKSNIAIVNGNQEEISSNSYLNVSFLKKMPPMSELVQNRYDAVIVLKKNGNFQITTLKNKEYKENLEQYLANKSMNFIPGNEKRDIGTNIIGYMLMFVLMQGILYARLFADDKEKHQIERISMSPIPFTSYLTGQGSFMWLLIVIPSFLVIVIARLFQVSIGFSLLQYFILIGILAFLAVAFALFLNSFFCVADTANMLGSSLVVLTSILAGSFYSFTKENSIFGKVLHLLPQKDFVDFTNALEKGKLTDVICMEFGYVIIISLIMLTVAVIKTRRDYVYHK